MTRRVPPPRMMAPLRCEPCTTCPESLHQRDDFLFSDDHNHNQISH